MASILSTKILSPSQKELLINSGLALVQYDAIQIEYLDFQLPQDKFDYLVFTSQNGVKSFLAQQEPPAFGDKEVGYPKAFCVGQKTQVLLEQMGFEIVEMAENAAALGETITANHNHRSFLLFSGNLRRDELPTLLKKNTVRFSEVISYSTLLRPKQFFRVFSGILLFSPSGVESYFVKNVSGEAIAFCIGSTTANEAKKYTDKIIIANKPTIENVIVKAIQYFAAYD